MSIDFESPDLLDDYLSAGTSQDDADYQGVYGAVDIESELNSFDPEPLSSGKNIIDYWNSQKSRQKHLYELAKCIYAIPPTEVEIERDFSQLNFVLTQRRNNLSEKNLEAILRIHLNKELFFIIKQEELSKIIPCSGMYNVHTQTLWKSLSYSHF